MTFVKKLALVSVGFLLACGEPLHPAPPSAAAEQAKGSLPTGASFRKLTVDGRERYYKVVVPKRKDPSEPVPVILAFHGGGSRPASFETVSQLSDKGIKRGYVVVYPAGYKHFWHSGDDCCGPPYEEGVDDVAYVRAVLDDLSSVIPVDPQRTYALGFSNGGKMTYRIACTLTDRFAAIAVNGSSLGIKDCKPKRPLPVLHFHGTADTFHPYGGGRGTATKYQMVQTGAPETNRRWAKWNGCTNETRVVYQKGDATCVTRTGCPQQAEVILCTIEGMGHQWPGFTVRNPPELAKKLGPGTKDLSASDMALDFFERHSRSTEEPVDPQPSAGGNAEVPED